MKKTFHTFGLIVLILGFMLGVIASFMSLRPPPGGIIGMGVALFAMVGLLYGAMIWIERRAYQITLAIARNALILGERYTDLATKCGMDEKQIAEFLGKNGEAIIRDALNKGAGRSDGAG